MRSLLCFGPSRSALQQLGPSAKRARFRSRKRDGQDLAGLAASMTLRPLAPICVGLSCLGLVVFAGPTRGADDSVADRVAPAQALERIARQRAAVESDPSSLTARWKLLRALHYLSEFTTAPPDRRAAAIAEAVALAEDSIAEADAARSRPGSEVDPSEAARVYFWSAIAWGARGQRVGLLTIVREGVATRIFENASRTLELDPTVERGGAYRLLSRLHAELPRVPFITGWVDRDQALPLAERGLAVAPGDPGNQLVVALALLGRDAGRRDEAIAWLRRAASAEPRPELLAEDRAIAREATERLSGLGELDRE